MSGLRASHAVETVNFSASWRGSGSARWRSDGPDEQWPSGSPRFARRPGDLARLFPDVLMGGRLFPTGNERELGVDTDDRSSSRASGVRWTRRSLVADDGALESGSVVRDHGLCRACRWRTRRVRRASFKAADTLDLDPCAWLRAVLGAAIEEVRGSARGLTGRRGVAVDLPLSSPARAACCRRRARQRRRG